MNLCKKRKPVVGVTSLYWFCFDIRLYNVTTRSDVFVALERIRTADFKVMSLARWPLLYHAIQI